MNAGNDDSDLVQLYRSAERERSPARLDAKILEAAARRTRTRKSHARLRLLAVAAVVVGLAIGIPRWQSSRSNHTPAPAVTLIDRHSTLAEALRRLPVAQVDTSVIANCLRRRDLCSNEPDVTH
jgi:hypothetical protein